MEWVVRVLTKPMAPISMCVLMRARYAEQTLEQAVEDGITQYVIIGAGIDSFAFRRPDLMKRIDVFEIDHPVTQRKKLERIGRTAMRTPSRMHFVPADLERVSTPGCAGRLGLRDVPANVSDTSWGFLLSHGEFSGRDG